MKLPSLVRQAVAHRAARWVVAAVVLLAVLWVAKSTIEAMGAWRADKARLRTALAAKGDSLAAARKAYARAVAQVEALEPENRRLREASARSAQRATIAERTADSVRTARRAITPPSDSATASDSVAHYRAQLAAAEREAELLREALERRWDELARRDSIDRVQRAQIAILRSAADSAAAELTRVQPLLQQAGDVIRHSEPACRIARLVPCPSRTVSFALGAGAVVLTYNAIQQLRR